MDLFKPFRKKELGLPKALQWQYVGGIWIPYDSNDSVFVNNAYKAIPIVQSIVSKVAEKAADAPLQLMKVKNERMAQKYLALAKNPRKDNAFERIGYRVKGFEQIERHPFLDLVDDPNPVMTGRQLREEIYGYTLITGNGIIYASVPGAGARASQPVELWSIPSPSVKPVMSGDRMKPLDGYAITYHGNDVIPTTQIAHFKYFNPVNDYEGFESTFWGLSPLRSSINLISQKKYADQAQGSLFANMSPAGLISGTSGTAGSMRGELTESQAVAVNDSFRQNHMGVYNAGDIIVTPADVKWVQIGLSPVDMGILDFNKDLERQIANVYGYPSQLLSPDGTLANSDSGDTRVVTNCVLPLLRKCDDIWTNKVREWYNDKSLFVMSDTDVYPELEADKKELVQWMRQAGVFTQDEIRMALGYGTEYDPAKVLIPSNLMLLSDLYGGDLQTNENEE